MIVVFFPGFDRFIPGFDRFIPGFDKFIPASIPITGTPPPLQSKCTLVNKMCIVLYFEIILFHFIWKNFLIKQKHLSILRTNIFAEKITLTPIQGFPRVISMPQAVDCDPQAVTGVSPKCCKQHAEGA